MKPTRLELANFRSFSDVDLDLPDGCVGLVGVNGGGKSSLLMAIEYAVFGPRGRSHGDLIRAGEQSMTVILTLEHGAAVYRIRRAAGRKTTLDFECQDGDAWEPLTLGTAADTQALVEQTIGLSRETFLASAYLAQQEGGTFTEAAPKDRKRLLADVLALTVWDEAAQAVAADRRAAQTEEQTLAGRVAALTERVEAAAALRADADTLTARLADADRALADATGRVIDCEDVAGKAAAAVEVWRRAQQDVATAEKLAAAHRKLAVEAQTALERLDGERPNLAALDALALEHAGKAATLAELDRQEQARARAIEERDRLNAEHGWLIDAARRHESIRNELDQKRRKIDNDPHATCPTCEQALPDRARETALASLAAELEVANAAVSDARDQAAAAGRKLDAVVIPQPVPGLDQLRARVTEIQHAPSERAAASARIEELERTAALLNDPGYLKHLERLEADEQAARAALQQLDEPEPGATEHSHAALLTARAAQEAARTEQARAGQDLARVDGQLRAAADDAAQLDQATADRSQLAGRLADLATLERAFGRDGIPRWIVETHAIPAIEQEANRLLNTLGGPVTQVELRTERELKSGGLTDALDIICHTDTGARDYLTFSGGERTRIALALRIALARLLAHRRDADVRLLVLDEPDGLDTAGMEALVDILRGLVQRGDVDTALLASHVPALRDSFDQALIVERDDEQGSRVVLA
ncbi:MAG: SMC family ATPase [Polyangiaceae bacterium]|nr:SMC family ATPase [Polyangiaceae bacterium]